MNRTHWSIVIALLFLAAAIVITLVGGYALDWQWAGLGEFRTTVSPDQIYERQKTLWDWLDLLIVPAALAVGALLLSRAQQKRALEIAADERAERALQNYYDRMSTLLIEHDLSNSSTKNEPRAVAQALTLSTIRSIDRNRLVLMVRFLHSARLIDASNPIIRLSDSNFARIEFPRLNLYDANLPYINFTDANFRKVNLVAANLSGATLERANVFRGTLYRAKLIGTNMVDADLTGADLGKTDLAGAILARAILENANLADAILINADMSNANLSGANLSGADLTGANLSNANLTGANFSNAYMFGVDLRGADTYAADFTEAIILNQVE